MSMLLTENQASATHDDDAMCTEPLELEIAGILGDSPLVAATPLEWAAVPLASFDAFMLDHACCERKAAALCLSFVGKHSDKPWLTEPLVALAREELEHFLQVYRLIQRRGLTLGPDAKDPYVNDLIAGMRSDVDGRFLDRLVVSGLIEARGCERFHILANALHGTPEAELAPFYEQLSRSEAGHYKVFLRIAERQFGAAKTAEALRRLSEHEARVMLATPWSASLH
jgi:tRNA-(ms[2]io[6]A)-hydroxylase